jgi:hypothetical protein
MGSFGASWLSIVGNKMIISRRVLEVFCLVNILQVSKAAK